MISFFEDKHPYRVVDAATGETLWRFSNLGAAYATARSEAREFAGGLDVIAHDNRIAHCGSPHPRPRPAEHDETLP